MVKICLTVRVTTQTGTKVGHNDPAVMYGNTVAYRKKETLGITDLSWLRVLIDAMVWYLDVGCDPLLVREEMYFS